MRRAYRLPARTLGEPYFIVWQPAAFSPLGSNGIVNGGINPATTAQYALTLYGEYIAGGESDAELRRAFLTHADFLKESADASGRYAYHFRHDSYGLSVPWYSAMPQGEAAAVLLRAYALTANAEYVEAARHALEPLKSDVRDGGVSYIRADGVFFEEAASPERPVHVLNGHLFAAFGVWELLEYGFADDALRELHETAVTTLRRWLPQFDMHGWSRYALAVDDDKLPHVATLLYHQFHVAQLAVYAAMTGEPLFQEYSTRWRESLDKFSVRLRYVRHSMRRMAYGLRRVLSRAPREWRPYTPGL